MTQAPPITAAKPASPLGAPAAPTRRVAAIDILRGVAVLGILAMNVQSFSMPAAGYMMGPSALPTIIPDNWLNRLTHGVIHTLFDLKMMALFSMLFGAGVLMFAGNKLEAGADVKQVRRRWLLRCGWLLLIGLLHAYFIWHGDILVLYAVCGLLFLWPARRLAPAMLLAIGGAALGFAALLSLGLGLLDAMLLSDPQARAAMPEIVAFFSPTPQQVMAQVEIWRGGYPENLARRSVLAAEMQLWGIPLWGIWRAGGLMLIGMALYKLRIISGQRSRRFYLVMMAAGYGVGLPLVLGGLWFAYATGWDAALLLTLGGRFNEIGSLPVALGHMALVFLLLKNHQASPARLGKIMVRLRALGQGPADRLAAVGRMALTNYLAQSILATWFFYGYGLGYFARFDRWEQQIFVLAVWLLQLTWSPLWLAYFQYGPAEWLWRCLTYGRLLPMKSYCL